MSDATEGMPDLSRNTQVKAQVLTRERCGCGEPRQATFGHVSSGTFLCGSCDTRHPYAAFSLDGGNDDGGEWRVIFWLSDEDAEEFAGRAMAGDGTQHAANYEFPPNVDLLAQLLGTADEDGRNQETRVRHVSSGVSQCAVDGELKPYVAVGVDCANRPGFRDVFLMLGEHAVAFAAGVRGLTAGAR